MSDEPMKPCPFCGVAATTVSGSTAQDGFFRLVLCPECNIHLPDETAWNRREPGPATRAMREAVQRELREYPESALIPVPREVLAAFLAEWDTPDPSTAEA